MGAGGIDVGMITFARCNSPQNFGRLATPLRPGLQTHAQARYCFSSAMAEDRYAWERDEDTESGHDCPDAAEPQVEPSLGDDNFDYDKCVMCLCRRGVLRTHRRPEEARHLKR